MHLLYCLVFIEATFNFSIAPADHVLTPTPTQLLDLLLEQQADWTSLTWHPRFRAIFSEDYPVLLNQPTKPPWKNSICFAHLDPIPCYRADSLYFSAFLVNHGLSPQTGKSYLAAVCSMQISLGLPDPREQSSMPILKRVQAGIRRVRMERGTQPRIRLPITLEVLRRVHHDLTSSHHPHQQLLWAISALAFFGFYRLGELLPDKLPFNSLSQLAWGDVAVDSHQRPQMVQVHLKKSKCNQFGTGSDVVVGRTDLALCPILATVDYVAKRDDRPGPFFPINMRDPVLKLWFITQLRAILAAVRLPQDQYAGHSFHVGAATTAALVSREDSTIKTLGWWHSAAFLQYICMPKGKLVMSKVLMGSKRRLPAPPRGSK